MFPFCAVWWSHEIQVELTVFGECAVWILADIWHCRLFWDVSFNSVLDPLPLYLHHLITFYGVQMVEGNVGDSCRCYMVAYSESKRYAFPAPFGGLAFIAAWASLLFWTCLCTALSSNRRKATCTRDNALWSSWTYDSWLLRLYIYMAHSWQDSQSWINQFHSRVFSQRWPYCATGRHMFLETILVFFSLCSWPAWIFNVAE